MNDLTMLSVKDALEIFSKHREAILTMWGFYSTVTVGVLGFTVGSDKVTHDKTTTRLVQWGYAAFSAGNAIAIASSQWELRRMAETIRTHVLPPELLGMSSCPLHPGYFVAFHIVTAFVVILGIQRTYEARSKPTTPTPAS
jgi:hypothetical protein